MLIDALREGTHGIRMEVPEGRVRRSDEHILEVIDDARGVVWYMLFEPFATDLDPRHTQERERDVEASARAIFHQTEATLRAQGLMSSAFSMPEGQRSRVDEPSWSPLVEHALVPIDGEPALRVIHRTAYRPGCEFVMGHLVVTSAQGTLEVRVIAQDRTTGMRECVVFVQRRSASGTSADLDVPIAQSEFDDPALDASFPQHCLSRVRFALAWAQEPGRIRREAHDRERWEPVVMLPGFGSITVPPRFRCAPGCFGAAAFFTRSTFATTDGVWRLSTVPLEGDHDPGDRKRLEHSARAKLYALGIPELDALTAREERTDTGERWLHLELAPTADRCALVSTWWVHDGTARGLLLSAPIEASLPEAWAMLRPVTSSWRSVDRAADVS